MIVVDWTALGWGALLGAVAGAVFFAGLACGMWIALRGARPTAVLMVSAVLRVAALLMLTWWVAGQGMPGLFGFAFGFVTVRFVILLFARIPATNEARP